MASSSPRARAVQAGESRVDEYRMIYEELLFREAASTMALGLNLAFYRSFLSPRVAKLLAQTGVITGDPIRRASDTAVLVWEMVMHGFDDERGRAALRRMNQIHARFDIAREDHLYVLATLAVVPMQVMDTYGWRRTSEVERVASAAFYAEMGRLMGLGKDVPATFAQFEEYMVDYERRNLAYSDEARALVASTISLMSHRFPKALRGAVGILTSALMSRSMRRAAGVRTPPPGLTTVLRVVVRMSARRAHRRDPHPEHRFPDGVVALPVYPDGYRIEEVGHLAPEDARRA